MRPPTAGEPGGLAPLTVPAPFPQMLTPRTLHSHRLCFFPKFGNLNLTTKHKNRTAAYRPEELRSRAGQSPQARACGHTLPSTPAVGEPRGPRPADSAGTRGGWRDGEGWGSRRFSESEQRKISEARSQNVNQIQRHKTRQLNGVWWELRIL